MNKVKKMLMGLMIFILASSGSSLFSQDTLAELPLEYKRNTIKWNLTPFILWDKRNINLSYERILSPYRSFSVNAGYFVLPSTGIYDSLNITSDRQKWGFSMSGDYRYYFRKRNMNIAPDGLYWGIYGSLHHYQCENNVSVIDRETIEGDLILNTSLNIFSAGVELGYQFIIKKKLSIDLVFLGPSLSAYNTKLTLDGDLTADGKEDYLQAIYDLLSARYPGFNELITTGERNEKGLKTSIGFGLRYLIQIGYRF